MKSQPTYKVCRRLGAGIFDKCQTQKFAVSETRHSDANRGRRRRNVSDYSKQLLEKQRIRFAYGIRERQLRRYVEESFRVAALGTDPAQRMVEQLEMRLDNIVYRAGLASTRRAARQLVGHGHVLVNGARTTVPSHSLREGDTFSLRERTRGLPIMDKMKVSLDTVTTPVWLSFDTSKLEGKISARPVADKMEMPGNVSSILEFYSR